MSLFAVLLLLVVTAWLSFLAGFCFALWMVHSDEQAAACPTPTRETR
jgi:hypothetical protein